MNVVLEWRDYTYFDYERLFARREVERLLGAEPTESDRGLVVPVSAVGEHHLDRLTYFARIALPDGDEVVPLQARLERSAHPQRERQSTRYSAHGLHEYKGKFNPQVVRAIGNMLGLAPDATVLDPFCGSGTTLLEAAHAGWSALGVDRNPLAAYIANAKLHALSLANGPLEEYASVIVQAIEPWIDRLSHRDDISAKDLHSMLGESWESDLRDYEYLSDWFPQPVLAQCVVLRRIFTKKIHDPSGREVFNVLLSNQLRDVSWQEPADLRIRRRKAPAANYPLLSSFVNAVRKIIPRVSAARAELGEVAGRQLAILADMREDLPAEVSWPQQEFTALITSPPYATALPYIDTQRLSLVLLGLITSKEIRSEESALVGAREISTTERRTLETEMLDSANRSVTREVLGLCREMHTAAGQPGNGFRRRNKPALVYRYFRDMAAAFSTVKRLLAPGAPAAFVVGTNRTTLGGQKFTIDTPSLLAGLGEHAGFSVDALLPMDTYPRYDLHQKNSINEESLLVLRA